MDILNQVFNEDCLIGMKRIPTGSVDLILCDLPYGTIDCAWDVVIPFEPLWAEYERIIKDNGAIILTASQPFTTDLINSRRKLFRYELIWEKTKASGFLNARKMPNKCHENVLVFYKKPPTYNPIKYKLDERFNAKRRAKEGGNMGKSHCFRITGKAAETYQYKEPENGERFPDSILCFKSESGKGMHPTQKPVAMFEWLIKTYTNEGFSSIPYIAVIVFPPISMGGFFCHSLPVGIVLSLWVFRAHFSSYDTHSQLAER